MSTSDVTLLHTSRIIRSFFLCLSCMIKINDDKDFEPHMFQQHALSTLANTEIVNFAAGNPIPVPPFHKKTGEDVHSLTRTFDSLCDDDEDAMNPLRGNSSPPHCTHGPWLVLDLDGDRWDSNNGNSVKWKNYGQFTLSVSGPHP
jgi:hypothetical protein